MNTCVHKYHKLLVHIRRYHSVALASIRRLSAILRSCHFRLANPGRASEEKFTLAAGAVKTWSSHDASWNHRMVSFLEDRLLALLKAICTQMMRQLATLHTWLHRIRENTRTDFGKLIAFRLSIPVFQLANFFFQLAYALGERRLFLLGSQDRSLRIQQLGSDLRDCGTQLVEISKGLVCLHQIGQRTNTTDDPGDLSNHE